MKKLLFFLSFILTCYTGLSQAPVTVTLKAGQFGVGSLLPVNPFTILGNPTGSIAVPQAYGIGYGLIFQGGKLAVDTTIKDTVFAYNGLQWIGPGVKTIGLGGFLALNTTISGSNLYDLTIDSMQAAISRGFRVNFGNDAGYDMIYRDSATNHWTRGAKGTPGQVWTMLFAGGMGWSNGGGGGSTNVNIGSGFRLAVFGTNNIKTLFGVGVTIDSTTNTNALTFSVNSPVIQTITGGSTVTINDNTNILRVNSTSVIPSLTVTLPTNWPINQEVKICFTANGTITSGNIMVTSITVVNGSGQTLSQAVNPNGTTINAGENIIYDLIGTVDQRIQ